MRRNRRYIAGVLVGLASLTIQSVHAEDKKIFSGPQVGEKLPTLKVKGVYDKEAGKDFDFAKLAGEKPAVLIFMHKLTRPSAAVTRTLLNYAGKTKPEKLFAGMVLLTDDVTDGRSRLKRARRALNTSKNARTGISPDGKEGPGAYGLNRNMTMTILVADKGRVTANFALVQPSVQADVLKVVKEITKLTGKKMPKLSELFKNRYARRKKNKNRPGRGGVSPQLGNLLRALIQKDNKPADVEKAVKDIEAYFKKNPKSRVQVGNIARRIIAAGKLENYGTKPAQEYLKKWAKEFKPKARKRSQKS